MPTKIKAQEFDLTLYIHIFALAILSITLIYSRMKCVEMGYEINRIDQDVRRKSIETKELKADVATLMSSEHLNTLAKKHKLYEPDQTQVIVVP